MGNPLLRYQAIDPARGRELRSRLLDLEEAVRLARQGQALSDPHRLQVLQLLRDAGELCVSDACLVTEREQSGVSRNLRILWDAGLVDKARRDKNLYYWPTSDGERLLEALLGASEPGAHPRSSRPAISASE